MRLETLSCIRPNPDRIKEALAGVPHTRTELDAAISEGRYALDASRALYVCEFCAEGAAPIAGVVGCLDVSALEDGSIACAPSLRPADETAFDAEIETTATRMLELRAQDEAVTLVHPQSLALDVIVSAAQTGTPLLSTALADGSKLTVWRIGRADAVEALQAVFAGISSAGVIDHESHVVAEAAERVAARTAARVIPVARHAPWTKFPVLLIGGVLGTSVPRLPRGLIMHAVG